MAAPADSPNLVVGTHVSPLWFSHHRPGQYDRCVTLGKHHVCRRCLVLYPVLLLTAASVISLAVATSPVLVIGMWVLPLAMTLDWVSEYLGRTQYSASRQVLLTALAAPAFGCALALHVRQAFTPAALAPMTLYVLICCAAVMWRSRKARAPRESHSTSRPAQATPCGTQVEPPEWEQAFLAEEAERTAALHALLR